MLTSQKRKCDSLFPNVFWFPIYSWTTPYTFHNDNSIDVIFQVEKIFNAFICNMCGKYTKNKQETSDKKEWLFGGF